MLNLIAVLVITFLGWLLGRAIGNMIGFRGIRPLLERPARTKKFRLKTIDQGEKLFERFTWLGGFAALWPVTGINKVLVPTLVFASMEAVRPRHVHCGNANLAALPSQLSSRGGGGPGLLQSWEYKETLVSMKRCNGSSIISREDSYKDDNNFPTTILFQSSVAA